MKTIREQIIGRIIAQLEKITPDNGYENHIGFGYVYRDKPVLQQDVAPAASVWELSESRRRNAYGGTVRVLTLRVDGIVRVEAGEHPAARSNSLLGDIEKALIIGDTTLDEFIDDIQDISAKITHLPPDRELAGASITFEIGYTTDWGDPYSRSTISRDIADEEDEE